MSILDEAPPFRVHLERRQDGVCVLVVFGEVDMHAAPELDRSLRECEYDGVKQVVVDFTDSTLLDSTGLGVLVAAQNRLEERGVPLKVAGTNRLIRQVFGITGLDRVFRLHASTEAALDGKPTHDGQPKHDGQPTPPGAASES
jgi:anti-sigma B factor antagonist